MGIFHFEKIQEYEVTLGTKQHLATASDRFEAIEAYFAMFRNFSLPEKKL